MVRSPRKVVRLNKTGLSIVARLNASEPSLVRTAIMTIISTIKSIRFEQSLVDPCGFETLTVGDGAIDGNDGGDSCG